MEFEEAGKTRKAAGKHLATKTKTKKKTKKSPGTDTRTARKKSSAGKTALIILLICVAAVFALTAVGMFYVNASSDIFSKVSVDGVDIGGKSSTEALSIMSQAMDKESEDVAVNVLLPQGYSITITGEEAGLAINAFDKVDLAVDACRGGNVFTNSFTYIKCLLFGMQLDSSSVTNIDEDAIRAKVEAFAYEARLDLMSSDLKIGEKDISVVKGANSVTIDSDKIVTLVINAFKDKNYADIVYEPEISSDSEIDLDGIYKTVYSEPRDASYDKQTDSIIPSAVGVSFDVDKAQSIWDSAAYGETVVIPIVIVQPELSTEDLENILFADLLATKSTSLSGSSSNRITNVALACKAIDGLVLMPGEEFNYNEVVGERTPERGYLLAGAYSDGQTIQAYGGGICQVSSTIYYCALYSNLNITSRLCHMFPVAYLPPGLDATVSWGGPEFKFVNDRDYPIKIRATVKDNTTCDVEIWGTDVDGSYVEMTYATAYVFHEKYTNIAIGYKAWTYRSVYDKDGKLISKKDESASYYAYHVEDLDFPEESEAVSTSLTDGESPDPNTSPSPEPDTSPSPDLPIDPTESEQATDDAQNIEDPFAGLPNPDPLPNA